MDKLVGEQLQMGIIDISDLGNYFRLFYTIYQILANQKPNF
jgi:hypothetical protein